MQHLSQIGAQSALILDLRDFSHVVSNLYRLRQDRRDPPLQYFAIPRPAQILEPRC